MKSKSATISLEPSVATDLLAPVCPAAEDTQEEATDPVDPFPSCMSITSLDRSDYADYIGRIQARAKQCSTRSIRPRVWLHIDPTAADLPATLASTIQPYADAFHAWRTQTTIQQNFTDQSLTARLKIPFDGTGAPLAPTLALGFEFWGVPDDAFPSLEQIKATAPHAPTRPA